MKNAVKGVLSARLFNLIYG
ncbi:hypothetical protein ACNKHT_08010 [Shigella flexneri]